MRSGLGVVQARVGGAVIRVPEKSVLYLRQVADYPLGLLVDHDGTEWTWIESRSFGLALRGRLEGVGAPALPVSEWRASAVLAFAAPRKRWCGVTARDPLVVWAGTPWWPPENACPHCQGTGRVGGHPADHSRGGALRDGVYVDRNLLGRIVSLFDPGALVIEARPNVETDAIRLRSVTGGARAVLARLRGHTRGLETYEQWAGKMVDDGLASLPLPSRAPRVRTAVDKPIEHAEAIDSAIVHAAIASERVNDGKRAPIDGPSDLACPKCGKGVLRSGQCSLCKYIP